LFEPYPGGALPHGVQVWPLLLEYAMSLPVEELAFPTRTTILVFDSAKSSQFVLENWGLQYMPDAGDWLKLVCRMPSISPRQLNRIPPAAAGGM
jgi:hypothetical protein